MLIPGVPRSVDQPGFANLHMDEGSEAVQDGFHGGRDMMEIHRGREYQNIRNQDFFTESSPIIPGEGTPFEQVAAQATSAIVQIQAMGMDYLGPNMILPGPVQKTAEQM